jgi:Ni,Fe-hydrogenase maturation factor
MPLGKILITGLGNPILGDAVVGWVVAREVEERIREAGRISKWIIFRSADSV